VSHFNVLLSRDPARRRAFAVEKKSAAIMPPVLAAKYQYRKMKSIGEVTLSDA
jgi:hypothetical protein